MSQKIVGNLITDYYLNGDRVEFETKKTVASPNTIIETIQYFYDDKGDLYSFAIKSAPASTWTNYYYVRNGQNDIIGIIDTSSTKVVSYVYDSWGKLISTTGTLANTIGVINPYRYRGYRYDVETGLFYVGSRYYDPQIGRWINADDTGVLEVDQDSLIENNLFTYCLNNPVNMTDDTGEIAWFVAAAIGGALFDTAAYMIGCAISGEKMTWAGVGKAALVGAITGVCFGALGKGVKLATTAIKASKTAKKFTSAGIKIINSKYANKVYKGIKFNKYGFPNFSKFSKATVKVKGLVGNYTSDFALANKAAGFAKTPIGYTWHHVEDGLTMMLVPTELHKTVSHTGGVALLKSIFG